MAAPKSSMKIDKNGVRFEESVDKANYYIRELTRAAMRDVARFILYEVRKKVNGLPMIKGAKGKKYEAQRYQKWVLPKECYLQLGIENTKHGAESAWWADQAELGTHNQPRRGFLRDTVYNNIEQIRKIEAQYLSAIDDELKAATMVDETAGGPEEDGDIG